MSSPKGTITSADSEWVFSAQLFISARDTRLIEEFLSFSGLNLPNN